MTMTEIYECVIKVMLCVCFKIIYVWFYFLCTLAFDVAKGGEKMGILEIMT